MLSRAQTDEVCLRQHHALEAIAEALGALYLADIDSLGEHAARPLAEATRALSRARHDATAFHLECVRTHRLPGKHKDFGERDKTRAVDAHISLRARARNHDHNKETEK